LDAIDTPSGRKHIHCKNAAKHHLPDGTLLCTVHWRMSRKRNDPDSDAICNAAHQRVCAVLRCLAVLVPDATPRKRKRLANKILTLCDGVDRSVKITQGQAEALIMPHLQCIRTDCPQLCFWEPISRSLNLFFNEEGANGDVRRGGRHAHEV
jgi:hypothetical protein